MTFNIFVVASEENSMLWNSLQVLCYRGVYCLRALWTLLGRKMIHKGCEVSGCLRIEQTGTKSLRLWRAVNYWPVVPISPVQRWPSQPPTLHMQLIIVCFFLQKWIDPWDRLSQLWLLWCLRWLRNIIFVPVGRLYQIFGCLSLCLVPCLISCVQYCGLAEQGW